MWLSGYRCVVMTMKSEKKPRIEIERAGSSEASGFWVSYIGTSYVRVEPRSTIEEARQLVAEWMENPPPPRPDPLVETYEL